jgi:carbon monoxide dehydrogenase subunit G
VHDKKSAEKRRGRSMAVTFGGSVTLNKPMAEVFAFLTDPGRDTNWRRPYVLSSRKLTEGPFGVGAQYETVNKFLGKKEKVVTEITAVEPPTLVQWKQINKGTFVADGSYRLEPANGGTRFTLELSGEGHGLMKPFQGAFVRYQQRKVIPRFLRQLQEAVG